MNPETEILLVQVVALAVRAGVEIMAIYRDESRWQVQHKEDNSPLTAADIAANRCIVAGLNTLTPDIPVISEECDEIPYEIRREWSRCWLVDPLDGTKEFIARNDEFSVNIALVENHEAVLGVVYAPVTGISYVAVRGQGAWRIAGAQRQRLTVANLPNAGERAVRIVASRRHRSQHDRDFYAQVESDFGPLELTLAGSAFKICAVAEGLADVYPRFGPTMEWDTAAGQIVVEEAGGALVDARGRPFRYNQRHSLRNASFLVTGAQSGVWLPIWSTLAD
jgi:3'(2'), 5'-bisphosphate nucleotidase